MFDIRKTALFVLVGLGAAPALRAESIYEPNNTPQTAFLLPGGQWVVTDDLDGQSGRADTVLGHYDPTYSALLAFNDDAPGVGNGFGSQLLGVPLRSNGSAYFAVSGAPDNTFQGAHEQLGKYSVSYVVHGPDNEEIKSSEDTEWVTPSMVDTVWLDPDNSLPNWTGYTVDVTVNNVVGPGQGDSLDFFVFSGLPASASFTAQLTDFDFDGIIGVYNSSNELVGTSIEVGGVPTLEGITDVLGRVKLGVTAAVDDDFGGDHLTVGQYTLVVVPEPASGLMLLLGAALLYRGIRRRSKRRTA